MSALSPENGVEVKDTWQQTDLVSSLILLLIIIIIIVVIIILIVTAAHVIISHFINHP